MTRPKMNMIAKRTIRYKAKSTFKEGGYIKFYDYNELKRYYSIKKVKKNLGTKDPMNAFSKYAKYIAMPDGLYKENFITLIEAPYITDEFDRIYKLREDSQDAESYKPKLTRSGREY